MAWTNHPHRELFTETAPAPARVLLVTCLMLLENCMGLATPWIAGILAASLLTAQSTGYSYIQIIFCWATLITVQSIVSFFSNYLSGKMGEEMATRLRVRLFNHLQSLPVSFFNKRKLGKVLALITSESAILSGFVNTTLISALPMAFTFFGALLCILLIEPLVAALALILIPVFILITKIIRRRVRPTTKSMVKEYGEMLSLAEESLSTLPVIKAYGVEEFSSRKFSDSNHRHLDLTIKFLRTNALLPPLIRFLSTILILIILVIIGDKIRTNAISVPQLVSLMMYGMLLSSPVGKLASLYGRYQRAASAAEKLTEVFTFSQEPLKKGKNLPPLKGRILFEDIHFSYHDGSKVLNGLDLIINAFETICIVGENGVGKSTLASLLLRFHEPQRGKISIDGHGIQQFSIQSLRSQIGLVQQTILLQNNTVKENILLGKPGASDTEILHAARDAGAEEFINNLPHGFDTIIGDRGVRLSGGQQQRLSLARALIKNPPILILDEATAMFDPEGELHFIEQCREILSQKTVILITHRPASLDLADRIFKLKDGRLDEISGNAYSKKIVT